MQAHTWQSSAGDTPCLGCCQSVGRRRFWSCGAGGWWDTGGQKHWAGMCCSREAGYYYWFHCDSRCPCRPQHCLGLHLQGCAWQETQRKWAVLSTQNKGRCLIVFYKTQKRNKRPWQSQYCCTVLIIGDEDAMTAFHLQRKSIGRALNTLTHFSFLSS